MENCSEYSGSTIHTCSMKMEPPLLRTASKVYFPFKVINPVKVYFKMNKAISCFQFDLLLNYDLTVETFAVLTKAVKFQFRDLSPCGSMAQVKA